MLQADELGELGELRHVRGVGEQSIDTLFERARRFQQTVTTGKAVAVAA